MALDCTRFFHLLADDTRLRSLVLVQQEGELCVCELVHALCVIQPKISRHLATLRNHGIVQDRRAGQWVFYRLHPGLPDWAHAILDTAVAEAKRRKAFARDLRALRAMPGRPDAARCA